jgi:DNA-binding CsgD family transcriptional regulator
MVGTGSLTLVWKSLQDCVRLQAFLFSQAATLSGFMSTVRNVGFSAGRLAHMTLSKRDRDILRMVGEGQTAEEIAAKWGTSPARVAVLVDDITKSLDWLSEAQKFVLLNNKLWRLIADLEEATKDSGFDPKQAEVYLKSSIGVVERASTKLGDEVSKVEAAQARVFMEIIEKSLYHALGKLSVQFPELPQAAIEDEFRESLVWVAAEFDARDNENDF